MVNEKAEVANEFNICFISVASKLVSKLPTSSGMYGNDQVNKYCAELRVQSKSFAKVATAKIARMLA
jgi:hypothetical protein